MVGYILIVLILGIALFVLSRRKKRTSKTAHSQGVKDEVLQDGNEEAPDSETVNIPAEFPVYWFDESGNKVEGVVKMAQGLQVFDEKGNCIVDLNSNVAKVIGRFVTQGTSGTLTVEGGKPWAMLLQSPEAYDVIREHGDKEHRPSVHVLTDGTIKWDDCVAKQSVIIYGVY